MFCKLSKQTNLVLLYRQRRNKTNSQIFQSSTCMKLPPAGGSFVQPILRKSCCWSYCTSICNYEARSIQTLPFLQKSFPPQCLVQEIWALIFMHWHLLHKKTLPYLVNYALGRKTFLAIDLALEKISSGYYGLWAVRIPSSHIANKTGFQNEERIQK